MGEPQRKVEIKSMDDLVKAVAEKLGKKIEAEQKKPFSTIKAGEALLEQLDAVSDAPRRAAVGAAQKTGSLKEGGKAFLDQILEGIPGRDDSGMPRSGRVLESTPEYSELVSRDARRRGTPKALAEAGAPLLGSILDVAGGGVGVGEAVAVGKAGAKAAKAGAKAGKEALNVAKEVGDAAKKSTKEFLEASSLLEGGLQTGGIGRLKVESFDNASLEKMKRMTEALEREGADAAPKARVTKPGDTDAGIEAKGDATSEDVANDESLGAFISGGETRAKKLEALDRASPKGDRPRRNPESVLEDIEVANAKLAKRQGRKVDSMEGREGGGFLEMTAKEAEEKAGIPQRMAYKLSKKNPKNYAERVLELGDDNEGAKIFLDYIPKYHTNYKGVRAELVDRKTGEMRRLPEQRNVRAEDDGFGGKREVEKVDSDGEKYTGSTTLSGDEPSGVALLDEAEKLGRAETYRGKPDAHKKSYVTKDKKGEETVRSKHQGTSILDEEDMDKRMEGAVQKLQGTQADGATNAQRLRLEELGFDRSDSPHMTGDIADRIIADIEDGKWSPAKLASDKQAGYLARRGVNPEGVGSKEASELIGGFEDHRKRIESKVKIGGKGQPKALDAGEPGTKAAQRTSAPSEAQAYHLNRFNVPEDHIVRNDPKLRSEWIGFVKFAEGQLKEGGPDALRRKLTELNERIAKTKGPEADVLKAKRNVLEDMVGPGPAGSLEDLKRAKDKSIESAEKAAKPAKKQK